MAGVSDNDKFIRMLAEFGGSAGKKKLINALNWSEDKYLKVRNRLVYSGTIVVGTGQGGSVCLSAKTKYKREEDLYIPLRNAMQDGWGDDWQADHLTIEVTARLGKKSLGRWSQPDLCAVSLRTYKYLAQKHVDLWTFEVKPQGEMSVNHVLEAVAHSRYAHRTYVMFHIENENALRSSSFLQCLAEVDRHSIGLITFRNPSKYSDWIWHREAVRKDPNPENLNDFIEQQLPETMKDQVLKWLR